MRGDIVSASKKARISDDVILRKLRVRKEPKSQLKIDFGERTHLLAYDPQLHPLKRKRAKIQK